MILFLFLSHLGVGIVLTLLLVSREAGVKFFRFNAGLAGIIIAVALTFRPESDGRVIEQAALVALVVAESALLVYWATVGRALASIRPAILATACLGGVLALIGQAFATAAEWGTATQVLTVVSFLTSSMFLGGVCTAMILGHWYLVIPSLPVSHLQSIVKVHIASMVVRIAVVAAIVAIAIATWEPGVGPNVQRYILSVSGIFFWQRVLFGLLGPAVLSYLTWETAKIRSTQSATGILYVDFFTVVVGEVLAKYLLFEMRVPV